MQIEGRTIFWRKCPSVSSSSTASAVLKIARTFHASDRHNMGSTFVHIAWELTMMCQSKVKLSSFQIDKQQASNKTDRQANKQTSKLTNKQASKQTNKQTNKQASKQTNQASKQNNAPILQANPCEWDASTFFWHTCYVFDHTTPTAIFHLRLSWENLWTTSRSCLFVICLCTLCQWQDHPRPWILYISGNQISVTLGKPWIF